jgi:ribosomal protein L13
MEVSVWCNIFKDGQMALNDDPQKHKGRPKTLHTAEKCVIVKGLIRVDRRVKVREMAEVTGIAESTIHEIISDSNFRKVSACCVPKMLTEEHKSKRMAALLENLCHYQD